jgi:6-phosphogluconolactonase
MTADVRRFADVYALYAAAAAVFEPIVRESVQQRGVCRAALAGGSTPKGLYSLLAADPRWRDTVRWDALEVFWGDERHVPPDHADSNYRMAAEAMLSRVPIASAHVHRVRSEEPDAHAAAAAYEAEIRAAFGAGTGIPRFDLILLGLGSDAHTASLFPGTAALGERDRLVVANWVSKLSAYRITLTLPIINAARVVLFMVAGSDKAAAVRAVLAPDADARPVPAALVRPQPGKLVWLLDSAASGMLP